MGRIHQGPRLLSRHERAAMFDAVGTAGSFRVAWGHAGSVLPDCLTDGVLVEVESTGSQLHQTVLTFQLCDGRYERVRVDALMDMVGFEVA